MAPPGCGCWPPAGSRCASGRDGRRVPCLEVPPPEASDAERRGCAAVELFVDRALSARPALRLDEAAIATVADIVRHLDGMPLAIELAAARVAVLDLASILEHLSDRFPLLSGGPRTAPPRQQTPRAASPGAITS